MARLRERVPADLLEAIQHAQPRVGAFGRAIEWHDSITSTNDVASERAERGAPEGTTVAAGEQTAGRGRHGRTWASPAGSGLYVSVVLRPARDVVPLITIAAGVAIAEGISAATGLVCALKWPNDVYAGARKLAGILAEGAASSSTIAHVVLGFGVNLRPAAWPPDVAARATSIETELGRAVDRGLVFAECLAAFASRYDDLQRGRGEEVIAAWRVRARPLLDRPVEWVGPHGREQGIARDIDSSGALIVDLGSGVSRVISGEVRWI
jgi:BirA family biotin operon repressor/biotin-[acetyl-CoA-carboxylase] ligase